MRDCTEPGDVHTYCAALDGLAQVRGARAVGRVLAALTDENPELRAAAMQIATKLTGEGVTDAYVQALDSAATEARVAILDVLSNRGDVAALEAVVAALKDDESDVRIAAVKAAAAIGKEQALAPLAAFLDTENDDERAAAEDELTLLPGDGTAKALAAALGEASSPARCALLSVLARRLAADQLDAIFSYTSDDEESVRVAAIEAVGALASDAPAVQRLLSLLTKADGDEEREAIEDALVKTCQRTAGEGDSSGLVAVAVERDNARDYCSLLRVLARLGGAAGCKELTTGAGDKRAEVREAALRAFGDLPKPEASDAAGLLALAGKASELKQHVLGMRSFATLMTKVAGASVEERLELYRAGMNAARRIEEKKQLLSGMAKVADEKAIDAIAEYLANDTLRKEAGSAMISAAKTILPGGWAQARAAIERVIAEVDDTGVRELADKALKEVEQYEGFVTEWHVAGPYMVKGKTGPRIFDEPFAPEKEDAEKITWKTFATEAGNDFWRLDLWRRIGGDNRAAYLRTCVWSPTIQEIRFGFGSDDGIKAWLNGKQIHANNASRGCGREEDKVNATLQQGWNVLLLKIVNGGGGWGASARIRSLDGSAPEGVKFDANAKP